MFQEKLAHCAHPVAKSLLQLMQAKQSNLCLSADIPNKADFLKMVDLVGSELCMLKTHIDIIEAVDDDFIQAIVALSQKHHFLIFEDRKFADIGNTVRLQYQGGNYKIADWAHIVNAHVLPGPGIIDGLKAVGKPKGRGLLLLAQMSSAGNLLDASYTKKTIEMAHEHPDFVMGFISKSKLDCHPSLLRLSPGVKLEVSKDNLGQQYITPEQAVEDGADVIIVGRGIVAAQDPLATAKQYKERAWQAYNI